MGCRLSSSSGNVEPEIRSWGRRGNTGLVLRALSEYEVRLYLLQISVSQAAQLPDRKECFDMTAAVQSFCPKDSWRELAQCLHCLTACLMLLFGAAGPPTELTDLRPARRTV